MENYLKLRKFYKLSQIPYSNPNKTEQMDENEYPQKKNPIEDLREDNFTGTEIIDTSEDKVIPIFDVCLKNLKIVIDEHFELTTKIQEKLEKILSWEMSGDPEVDALTKVNEFDKKDGNTIARDYISCMEYQINRLDLINKINEESLRKLNQLI